MLYAILLLILAVMLFGSSAVIGAAGVVLGVLAAIVALGLATVAIAPWLATLGISEANVVPSIILFICFVLLAARVILPMTGHDWRTGQKKRDK